MDSNIPFNAHFSFTAMFLKHILCLSSWLSRKTPRLYKALAALVIPREVIKNDFRIHMDPITKSPIVWMSGFQTNSPWGLARLSNSQCSGSSELLGHPYYCPRGDLGFGTDIYVPDTGGRNTHAVFQGRVIQGPSFTGSSFGLIDISGHGTHMAGIAGGAFCGVAQQATIFAVKVAGDEGNVWPDELIRGLLWIEKQVKKRGRPSVVNCSLDFTNEDPMYAECLKDTINCLTRLGVHIVVPAGNDGCGINSMLARMPGVITVGASTLDNRRASFSNFGPELDVFAPGKDTWSACSSTDKAMKIRSGTSVAVAHVSGAIGRLISSHGNMPPYQMKRLLKDMSAKGILKDVPLGTANLLVQTNTTKSSG